MIKVSQGPLEMSFKDKTKRFRNTFLYHLFFYITLMYRDSLFSYNYSKTAHLNVTFQSASCRNRTIDTKAAFLKFLRKISRIFAVSTNE